MISAILDNATLTAAEIDPSMSQRQINAALYGLLISGGMLIPAISPTSSLPASWESPAVSGQSSAYHWALSSTLSTS